MKPFAGGQVWFQAGLLDSEPDHHYVMRRVQLAEIAFDPSLAVGHDRETGWYGNR